MKTLRIFHLHFNFRDAAMHSMGERYLPFLAVLLQLKDNTAMVEFFYWLKNEVILIYGLLVALIESCRSIFAIYEACSKNKLNKTSSIVAIQRAQKNDKRFSPMLSYSAKNPALR